MIRYYLVFSRTQLVIAKCKKRNGHYPVYSSHRYSITYCQAEAVLLYPFTYCLKRRNTLSQNADFWAIRGLQWHSRAHSFGLFPSSKFRRPALLRTISMLLTKRVCYDWCLFSDSTSALELPTLTFIMPLQYSSVLRTSRSNCSLASK